MHLSTRYDARRGIDDLNEAIVLSREALSLRPPGHPPRSPSPSNLSNYLYTRHKQLRVIDDLNGAVVLCQDALALRPPGHPDRSTSLEQLSWFLYSRFKQLCRAEDRQELFILHIQLERVSQTVFSGDLSAVKAWVKHAEKFHHSTTLLAYETALRLLVEHLASVPSLPQHLAVLKSLSSSLAVDAFSTRLRNQSPTRAVELLERGRGIFWSQLTRLRSPLDDVIASGLSGKLLADNFTCLTALIRMALRSPGADQRDRIVRLNTELQKVVTKIRELPGLSRFLLPSLFSDLQRAASGGPVIIMNGSNYGCNALVVFADEGPVHIPLSVTREVVRGLSSKLRTLTRLAKRMDMSRDFVLFLRKLWDTVVSRIFDVLQTICLPGSRIWWCPTAEFSLLPLHAASPYRNGQRSISDLYVSSYTTTLTALIRARCPSSPDSATEKMKRSIAIGQAAAKGADQLFSVGAELDRISYLVDGLATFTRLEGEGACIPNVVDELGKNEWAHFACHGIPNRKQLFESAFAVRDGWFTIQHIAHWRTLNSRICRLDIRPLGTRRARTR